PLPLMRSATRAPVLVILQSRTHSTPVTTSGWSGARNPWNPPRIKSHAFDDARSASSMRTPVSPAAPGAADVNVASGGDCGAGVARLDSQAASVARASARGHVRCMVHVHATGGAAGCRSDRHARNHAWPAQARGGTGHARCIDAM